MTILDLVLIVVGLAWLTTLFLGFYRMWSDIKSVPMERLKQSWAEEKQMYGGFPEGIGRSEELDEAWEKQVYSKSAEPFPTLSKFLSRQKFAQWLDREIKRAHVNLDIGTAFAILLLLSVSGFTLSLIGINFFAPTLQPLWRFLIAILAAFFISYIFIGWLRRKQKQFIRKVETVLPDTLSLMANALRAGMGFQQALDLVAMEGLSPLREEFAIVTRAISLGSSLEEALQGLLDRVPSQELTIVVTAVLVQREVGGSLAHMLDVASSTIRDRIRLRQEIRAETSLTRGSAFALAFGLPALVFVFANFASIVGGDEPWSAPMFSEPEGLKAFGLIALLEIGGWYWLKKILETLEE
ncbi:MAG: type II secretion system F family protein [Armatimonadetes bacterium]|nr:type II secretion system F family protein [Armatimonadota bacterium]